MQQLGIVQNRMSRPIRDQSMIKFTLRFSCFSLMLCLVPSVHEAATYFSDGDGERVDPSRFEKAVAGLKDTEQALFLYERIERVEDRKSYSDPNPSDVKIFRVFPAGTGLARIPLGPDSAPANAAVYRGDLEKLLNSLTWAAQSGKPQRDAYEKVTKKQKERAELIDQTRSAFLFTFLGEETRGDRKLSKFRMDPNPGYRPPTRAAAIFARVKGVVWLDEASGQMARIEGEVTEDISFGLFLGKLYKGSRFMQERYEIAPGVWLPSFSQYDFDARKLFSTIAVHQKTFASNYRRVGKPFDAIPVVKAELEKMSPAAIAEKKNGTN